jgi:glycosyltransferase involved in cell wall biosynthesis
MTANDSTAEPYATPDLSVVIPMYNETGNVAPMLAQVHQALAQYPGRWELIVVNDGSSDDTGPQLRVQAKDFGPHVRLVELQRNFGQTAAMQAGIDAARGEVIATLDGDLQNDPADIPQMVSRLMAEDLDLVAGWRKERKDDFILRRLPSVIANKLIRRITGVGIHDYGCSLKVYRSSIMRQVKLYGEMHRFIPAWVGAVTTSARIGEMVVNHKPRVHGSSKYGLSRTFRVILDLLVVFFFMRYNARPGHFFGSIGLTLGAIGSLALAYLASVKFIFGEDIGGRPLLLIAVLFVLASLQFLTTGVLAELLSRIYFQSDQARQYVIREHRDDHPLDADEAWHHHGPWHGVARERKDALSAELAASRGHGT